MRAKLHSIEDDEEEERQEDDDDAKLSSITFSIGEYQHSAYHPLHPTDDDRIDGCIMDDVMLASLFHPFGALEQSGRQTQESRDGWVYV